MGDATTANETNAIGDGLVLRARSDRVALGLLYDRYYPHVARYCLRRLFDRSVAEDVTSDVFLKVAAHLRHFSGTTEADFRCWLFRIASNAVNAWLRQTRRRQALWDAAARSRCPDERPGSRLSLVEHDLLDWPVVYQAILKLDERTQSIVSLRFFADCSHDEIARILQIRPGTVRTALSRSLARLREMLEPGAARDADAGKSSTG